MLSAYYNENDPYAAQWLRNLISAGAIAPGDVDGRSIVDVRADDLAGYTQCHFFAGIGGWSYALRLAGWPDDRPVWTGSCPCQPFSPAGRRRGFSDKRHLWPEWLRLIEKTKPPIIFGEQSAQATDWLWTVRSDLALLEYAFGGLPIEAACAGAPHRRDRYWFVADAEGERWQPRPRTSEALDSGESEAIQPERRGSIPARSPWHFTWATEPSVGWVAHGVPARMDKLRALGNAIVPQVAAEFIAACSGGQP